MGLRFRKRLKIAPGLYLNVSSSGTSWSLGAPGAMLNFGGRNGARATFGIPGSGLSYSQKLGGQKPRPRSSQGHTFYDSDPGNLPSPGIGYDDRLATPVASADIDVIGDMGMSELADVINQAEMTRQTITQTLQNLHAHKTRIDKKARFYGMIVLRSLFSKKLASITEEARAAGEEINNGQAALESTGVMFDWGGDEKILAYYRALMRSFGEVSRSKKIWDILSYKQTDKFKQRTQADQEVSREPVTFSLGRPSCLPASNNDEFTLVPHLENRNGGDVYIFPGFLLIESESKFAVVSISDINLEYGRTRFAETDPVPADSQVDGNTWRYANKNGGPDKRFNDNYAIPWAIYGTMSIRFKSVVHEEYMISNEAVARRFVEDFMGLIEQTKQSVR